MQISNIINIFNKTTSIPFSGFKYINNDTPPYKELNRCIDTFEHNPDQSNLNSLLNAEREILEGELREPDKNLAYLKKYVFTSPNNITSKDTEDALIQLQTNALRGIYENFDMCSNLKFPKIIDKFLKQYIKEIIRNGPENRLLNQKLKFITMTLLDHHIYKNLSNKEREEINNYLLNVYENSPSQDNKEKAADILSRNSANNYPANNSIKNQGIITNLAETINNEHADYNSRNIAIWNAGKIHSPENFNSLINFLNKKPPLLNKKDRENLNLLKETAISSLARYPEKREEIEEFLKEYAKSNPVLNRDINAVLKKMRGRHTFEDFYINELLPEEKSREAYKKIRNEYIEGINLLNNEQKNYIDKALIPMFQSLITLKDQGAKFFIIDNSSVTSILKKDIGSRSTNGIFNDTCLAYQKENIIASTKMVLDNTDYAAGHEFNHLFAREIMKPEDWDELQELYDKARRRGNFMDFYSAQDPMEYFAIGYEAYLRTAENHNSIALRDNYYGLDAHTYLYLQYKDPELYRFIEKCLKTYNNDPYKDIYKNLDKTA